MSKWKIFSSWIPPFLRALDSIQLPITDYSTEVDSIQTHRPVSFARLSSTTLPTRLDEHSCGARLALRLARESASLGFPTGTSATVRNLGIFMPPSPPSVIRSNPWTSCSKRKLFHDSGDAPLSSASSARFLLRQIFFPYANKRTIAASLTEIFSTGGLDWYILKFETITYSNTKRIILNGSKSVIYL